MLGTTIKIISESFGGIIPLHPASSRFFPHHPASSRIILLLPASSRFFPHHPASSPLCDSIIEEIKCPS
jgi:hypothetical protein